MIFGTKSEKITREIEQLELKLEELETPDRACHGSNPGGAPAKTKPAATPA